MKHIIITLSLFIFTKTSFSQDSTFISSLQLKGGTIKVIAAMVTDSKDTAIFNSFSKWSADYKDGSPPNDNANVTISFCKTTVVAFFYSLLLQLPGGYITTSDYITDFKTSINSKRQQNSFLDRLCTELESGYITRFNNLKTTGNNLLLSN